MNPLRSLRTVREIPVRIQVSGTALAAGVSRRAKNRWLAPFRSLIPRTVLTVAGVVGAATLGSGLFADLFGTPDNVANGQTFMARTPSMLAAPTGYAAGPAYNSMPSYRSAAAFNPQPYGYAAYPANGYGPVYPQAVYPQAVRDQYQPTNVQPSWPYVQSNDGQASVLLRRRELPGGPPLASPQVQVPLPAPSQQVYHNHMPMQQAPPNAMQSQMMPGSAMPAYPYGGASCDVWANGYAEMGGPPAARNWFGGVGSVLMTRDRGDYYTFSYGTGDESDERTNTRDAAMGWETGFDVHVGRYFNCQRNAIEAVYWGVNPNSQSTQTVSADVLGDLNGILNWNSLDYGGSSADVYVNVAPGNDGIHQLTRDYSFQNIELNLWRFCGSCATGKCSCSRLRHNWLVGIRYFRFDENLLFASNADALQITGADDDIFYDIDIKNHLLGFQVGNQLQYCVSDRLTADLGTKLGIYSNQISHTSEIGGNLGVATINNGLFLGEDFSVRSSKNDVAFLGEVNLGLRYCFNCRWTGTVGYRALAVTGVAVPADQIYPDLRSINDVANIDSSRALILHGGYAGLVFNW
ncbi:MAG: BBP7 family outer membrane beta-barrel protein [Planctomycetota bacterium]|nr:BBP7 family outer membrane beta-barrel protein [Planctomycetota bacterium]